MRIHNVVTICILIVISSLQSTIFSAIAFNGIKPNLLLVLIILTALLRGSSVGMIFGVVAGFFQDVFSGKVLGIYMLLGLYVGLLAGIINKRLYKENVFVAVSFTFLFTVIYEACIFIFSIFILKGGDLTLAFREIIIPEAIWNSIFALILFFPLIKYINWIDKSVEYKKKY